MSVKENLLQIKNSIPASVTLVAVSKTKSNDLIKEAYDAGQKDFGENYVQELEAKCAALPKDIRWHFIGHLQSNKVKVIAPFVYLIHGIDSLKLLEEVNKQALKNKRIIKCLLQIHIAVEETKFGLSFEECENLLRSERYAQLKNVKVIGLMAMASNTTDEKQIEKEFSAIKPFTQKLSTINHELSTLSFGMTSDYQLAIKNGSNMIRIGSFIFGHRNS